MTNKSTDKSREWFRVGPRGHGVITVGERDSVEPVGWFREQDDSAADAFIARHNAALTAAQSQLAEKVLASMSEMTGGTHAGGLVVVSREAAVGWLRDLFTRLGISVDEGAE